MAHAPLETPPQTASAGAVSAAIDIRYSRYVLGVLVVVYVLNFLDRQIITILADAAENVEEIDLVRAKAAKKRAEDALHNLSPEADRDAYLVMEAALRRSNLRLDVVRRYRGTAGKLTELDESL